MQPLFLKEAQVHTGMIVALALAEKQEPEVDEHGPLLLQALLGGIPIRKKLYPLSGRPQLLQRTVDGWQTQPLTQETLDIDIGRGMEGFQDAVRFMPIYTFNPKETPRNMEFVVYVHGERMKYESGRGVYIRSDPQGRLLSNNGYEYEFWQREYPVPDDAVFVPIARVKEEEPVAIVCHIPSDRWSEIFMELVEQAVKCGLLLVSEKEDQAHSKSGYFHLNLRGSSELLRREFVDLVVGPGDDDSLIGRRCPVCWRTASRRNSRSSL